MVLVVHHTELTWGHTMNFLLRVYHKFIWACPLKCGRVILWRVANLECYISGLQLLGKEVEILNREVLLVGSLWVVAVRYI